MKALLFAAIVLLLGCSKNMPDSLKEKYGLQANWKMATIKEGQHRASLVHLSMKNDEGFNYFILFDSSAIYYHDDPSYQDSWNKLPGIVEADQLCSFQPQHDRSAMFGWRWYEGEVQLGWYQHVDCDEPYRAGLLSGIELGEPYLLQLYVAQNGTYHWRVVDEMLNILADHREPRDIEGTRNMKSRTHISFGGIYPAPHDITVYYKIFN